MLSENDKKEELSRTYIQAVSAKVGFSTEKITIDRDSIDVIIRCNSKLDALSEFEKVTLEVQAKATSNPNEQNGIFKFPLPIKNYNDLRSNSMAPRIIVLYVLPDRNENWVTMDEEKLVLQRCAYWVSIKGKPESNNSTSVTIDIPKDNIFNATTLHQIMVKASKDEALNE
jgi:hypothetical protein